MGNRVVEKIKNLYRKDKLSFFFLSACYFLLFAIFVSFPVLSGIYPFNYVPIFFSVLFAVCVFLYLYIKKRLFLSPMMFSLLLFGAYSILVTCFGSQDFSYAFTLMSNILICCVIAEFVASEKCAGVVIKIYALAIAFFFIVFLFVYRAEILSLHFERIGELFGNLNQVGFTLLTGSIAFSWWALSIKKWGYLLFIPAVLIIVVALFTGSRAVLINSFLLFVFAIFSLYGRNKIGLSILTIVILAVLAVGILSLPIFTGLTERILSLLSTLFGVGEGNYDASSVQRFNMIIDGLNLWSKNIVFGYGLGGFKNALSYGTYSHATLIEVLCNSGLIGVLLFFIPVLRCSFVNPKAKEYMFSLAYFVCAIVVGLFFQMLIYSKAFYFPFSIMLGLYEYSTGGFKYTLFIERKTNSWLPSFSYQKGNISLTKTFVLESRDIRL